MKRAVMLVNGLESVGSPIKRSVLHVLAANSRVDNTLWISDLKLRNATELGVQALEGCLRDLHRDGWIFRDGYRYTLAVAKMEANQRPWIPHKNEQLAHEIGSRQAAVKITRVSSAPRTVLRKEQR